MYEDQEETCHIFTLKASEMECSLMHEVDIFCMSRNL